MKHPSQNQFELRNGMVFGSGKLLVCVPLISKNIEELINDAEDTAKEHPDVIEWRVDYYLEKNSIQDTVEAARVLRDIIGNIPVLFTPRQVAEGGAVDISTDEKLTLINEICASGCIDLLDVEIRCEDEFINKVREITSDNGVRLVLSYHDFDGTPNVAVARSKLKRGITFDADVCKLAVMPQNFHEVAVFAQFICNAKKTWMKKSVIISLMGDVGAVSRFCGSSLGSDLGFVSVTGVSGPGQMHVSDYRILNELIEG